MPNPFANGQLVAAVAVLVDALFGVLTAAGTIHTRPDQSTILAVVVVVFNLGSYVLAYIQHAQHIAPKPVPVPVPVPPAPVPTPVAA